MKYFLVDYENVSAHGLNGISKLSSEDEVIIFYSEKADTMTFELHLRLKEVKAEVSFEKVITGSKNALDFQLCGYAGYLIGQNTNVATTYYIVSSDQEYSVLAEYWRRRKIDVSLIPDIAASFASAPKASTVELAARVKELLPKEHRNKVSVITEIIERCQTKQSAHGELVRVFHEGADHGAATEIYHAIKPLLKV